MKATQISVRVVCDNDPAGADLDLPTDWIPAINDRVTVHRIPYSCLDRELQLEDGGVRLVTVRLRRLSD
jgi:hypothetical protein